MQRLVFVMNLDAILWNENMQALKDKLYQLIVESTDTSLLSTVTEILEQNQETGSIWSTLSAEEQINILLSDSETANPDKQVAHSEMRKRNRKWLN